MLITCLKKIGIDYTLSNDMLAYYAYKSFIVYMTDSLYKYVELKNKEYIQDIENDFFSDKGWVRLRINAIKM